MFFSKNNPNDYSARKELQEFFSHHNVEARAVPDKEDESVDYYFDYQGGHFIANVKKNDRFVQVSFPSFLDVDAEHFNLVRNTCNTFNAGISVFKFYFDINNDYTKLNLHMSFCDDRPSCDEFGNRLTGCFYYQRSFKEYIDDGLKQPVVDQEENRVRHGHINFLLHQQEINHQPGDALSYRTSLNGTFPLEQLLYTVMGLDDIEFKELSLNTPQGVKCITDAETIKNTDVVHAMVKDDATGYKVMSLNATLRYAEPMQDEHQRYANVVVTPSGCDDTSCYVRVTITVVPLIHDKDTGIYSNATKPECASVIIAVDRQSPEKKLQEFNYMWEDALIKIKNNEQLTEEQEHLASITFPDSGYNYYWAMRHFHQNRFYEAVLHLENVYNELRNSIGSMDDKTQETFYDVCFHLGFCYSELGNYDKAFFYLNMVGMTGKVVYAKEYVNTLANSRDVRALYVIDRCLGDVNDSIAKHNEKEMEVPGYLVEFAEFLQRRKGYVLINYGNLDDAEKLFKGLLDSNYSHDYAVNELAYIQQLRGNDKQPTAENRKNTTDEGGN